MSPTAREVAPNLPLSGTELRELIRLDMERLLDAEGQLVPHIAFGRVAWEIRLTLHTSNVLSPISNSHVTSRPAGTNVAEKSPELAAVESFPLRDADLALTVVSAHEAQRAVTSPNAERVRAGLPITVQSRQQDGSRETRKVTYPKEATQFSRDAPNIMDATAQAERDMGITPMPTVRREPTETELRALELAVPESRDFWGRTPNESAADLSPEATQKVKDFFGKDVVPESKEPWPVTKPE